MKQDSNEIAAVEVIAAEVEKQRSLDLAEMQLALLGGGMGEVVIC